MIDAQQLARRYVAAWNESDPARRRESIAEGGRIVSDYQFIVSP